MIVRRKDSTYLQRPLKQNSHKGEENVSVATLISKTLSAPEPTVSKLMCDEKIDENTPETSPDSKEELIEVSVASEVEHIKQNLSRKLAEAEVIKHEIKTVHQDFLIKSKDNTQDEGINNCNEQIKQKHITERIKKHSLGKTSKNTYKLEKIKFVEGIGSLQVNLSFPSEFNHLISEILTYYLFFKGLP